MMRTVEVRRGRYRDSVTLMQVSQSLRSVDGVESVLVTMATDVNLALLVDMGFDPPAGAQPNDMLLAINARDEIATDAARHEIDRLLTAPGHGASPAIVVTPPRTTASAARRVDATLALVSVPGANAFVEAMDALAAGLSVMVFSDNVPVAQEIQLKEEASRRGVLVMGPDCGTAIVSGVGFGFANVVRPGPVSIVAASGTGAQHLMSLLDGADVGVRHCLGVGGRDLSAEVGGRSTRQALDLLADDRGTELVIIVSKPPSPSVAAEIIAHAERLRAPVVFAFLGKDQPDLTAVAADVVRALGQAWTPPRAWLSSPENYSTGDLRGLFAGGTLCDEAMVIAERFVGPIQSNIPLTPELRIDPNDTSSASTMIDFGDDALTLGRPHPMIDGTLRIARLAQAAADSRCRAVLLDVVLGHGAHPDPAAELVPAIRHAHDIAGADGRELSVVVTLVGTRDDPQGLDRQAASLHAAGASVLCSNARAAELAASIVVGGPR